MEAWDIADEGASSAEAGFEEDDPQSFGLDDVIKSKSLPHTSFTVSYNVRYLSVLFTSEQK